MLSRAVLVAPARQAMWSSFRGRTANLYVVGQCGLPVRPLWSFAPHLRRELHASAPKACAATTSASANAIVGDTAVRNWLYGCSALVYGMVVLGGVTRLTESGLSMTDWSVTGSLPPMSAEAWEAEFAKYKKSPEYQILNRDFTVEDFQKIFWFEYLHRMLGRTIGVAFVVPFAYFAAKKRLSPSMIGRCTLITALIGCQGALGWYMVKSGLNGGYDPNSNLPPRVSQYRLAAHLSMAFAIYVTMLSGALRLHFPETPVLPATALRLRRYALVSAGLVGLTAFSGAFVAGLDAGLVYGTFPKMGDKWIPDEIMAKSPWWRNIFENDTTVQFNHRYLGITTLGAVTTTGVLARSLSLPGRVTVAATTALVLGWAQVALGITTLVTAVPVSVAASHQAGSLTLLSAMVWLLHELRRIRAIK